LSIKIFNEKIINKEIIEYFKKEKKPFVIKNIFESNIDLDFINEKFSKEKIIALNKYSDKKILTISDLTKKIIRGEK